MNYESPNYATSLGRYNLLRQQEYINRESTVSWNSSALVDTAEIEMIPGYWMYERYTRTNLSRLRFLYTIGYILEAMGFVAGMVLNTYAEELDSSTPFRIDPLFVTIMWGLIVVLGGLLTISLFKKTINILTLLTDQLKYCMCPLYLLLSVFLISKNYFESSFFYIYNDVSLFLAGALATYIYYKIKYEDDGRFFVTRLEFLAIHVHYSILTAWILIELCVAALVSIDQWGNSSNGSQFFGWKFKYWTVTIMFVTFALSVIILYRFKDVFFAATFAFTFFGVYSNQVNHCSAHCSSAVRITAVTLASILLIFAVITLYFYPRRVFYIRRNNNNNN